MQFAWNHVYSCFEVKLRSTRCKDRSRWRHAPPRRTIRRSPTFPELGLWINMREWMYVCMESCQGCGWEMIRIHSGAYTHTHARSQSTRTYSLSTKYKKRTEKIARALSKSQKEILWVASVRLVTHKSSSFQSSADRSEWAIYVLHLNAVSILHSLIMHQT